MTLILTVATEKQTIQVSDRRVTLPNGIVVDDQANKAVTVTCRDGRFTIAYTGAARIGQKSTDDYLVDYLTHIHAGNMTINDILESLKNKLRESFESLSISKLSLVCCGYKNDIPFIVLISNFEDVFHGYRKPTSEFRMDAGVLKQKKSTAFLINGYENAITDVLRIKLKRLVKKRFFLNNQSQVVVNQLVEIIREASRSPDYGKYIGQNCMSAVIKRESPEQIDTQYHPIGASSTSYAPHFVGLMISVKGIEISDRKPSS